MDILQELQELNEGETAAYTKQEREVMHQVETLRKLMEAVTLEVSAEVQTNIVQLQLRA